MSTKAASGHTVTQQAPGLTRIDLQREDLSVAGHEVVQARVEIGPEAPAVKRTHPGEEASTSSTASSRTRSTGTRPGPTAPARP
jgi:hypothetical protein